MGNEGEVAVRVKTIDEGSGKMRQFADSVKHANDSIKGAQSSWQKYTFALTAATGVMVGGALAAKKLYATLREGAVLQTTTQRFDKLAESIGTTAETMLGKLRTATQGMISDMDLMASASQIISLKLADNSEQVVRLATVVGTLGWDMNQVILTFANLSTMRLDALGLSVEEVKTKAAELEKQGMSATEAFKEAVILAGESRLNVGGVSETEKAFKQAEVAITNYKNSILASTTATLAQAGAFTALSNAAKELSGFTNFTTQIEKMLHAGELTEAQYNELNAIIRRGGVEAGEAALQNLTLTDSIRDTGEALGVNIEAYRMWSGGTQEAMAAVSAAMIATSNAIIMSVEGADMVLSGVLGRWQSAQSAAHSAQRNAALDEMMLNGRNGLPWLNAEREHIALLTKATLTYDDAATAIGGYIGGLTEAEKLEQELTEGRARMVAAFSAEINYTAPVDDPTTKRDEGGADTSFILENGLVNVEAMNKALFEQSEAAGASAMSLALLGVATGQFTEEQATAALKAAVLQERIMQLAKGITSGELSIGDALSNLSIFQQNIDAAAPGSGIQATIESLVSTIPAEDRTIDFLSDTGMVDDDIRRLESKHIVIPVTLGITNPDVASGGSTSGSSTPTTSGPTSISVDMNLDFHGTATAADVTRGIRDGMGAWSRDLRREGVF
jgi:hypothetical protein